MEIELLRDVSAWDELAREWNALVERGVSNVPFLRFEFQRTWWSTLGGGEWPAGELVLAVGRRRNGELAGAAPLFFAPNRDGRPALLWIGSVEIADYLDLVVAPSELEHFVPPLFDRLSAPDAPPWELLDLYNLPERSPSRAALASAARARGWRVNEQPLQPCLAIPLRGDWPTYLADLDKKQRHEIRRKMRRAEAAGMRWSIVDGASPVGPAIDGFLAMMASNPEKARFLTPAMRTQFTELARHAHAAGWLQLAFLEVDGRPAAGAMSFDYANRLWVYNSALDAACLNLSAGWVLLGHLIEWAAANGRSAFDFMRGDEDYKARLGAQVTHVYRLQIERTQPGA